MGAEIAEVLGSNWEFHYRGGFENNLSRGDKGGLDGPVFPADSIDIAEVTGIQGRHDAVMATRRGRDQQIEIPDDSADKYLPSLH